MQIKRNIFESSAKMPDSYQAVATPMTKQDAGYLSGFGDKMDSNVQHAPVPRIGEQS